MSLKPAEPQLKRKCCTSPYCHHMKPQSISSERSSPVSLAHLPPKSLDSTARHNGTNSSSGCVLATLQKLPLATPLATLHKLPLATPVATSHKLPQLPHTVAQASNKLPPSLPHPHCLPPPAPSLHTLRSRHVRMSYSLVTPGEIGPVLISPVGLVKLCR